MTTTVTGSSRHLGTGTKRLRLEIHEILGSRTVSPSRVKWIETARSDHRDLAEMFKGAGQEPQDRFGARPGSGLRTLPQNPNDRWLLLRLRKSVWRPKDPRHANDLRR